MSRCASPARSPSSSSSRATGESGTGSEDLSARITLRLPDSLKSSIETAAAREGVSVNTWLVRALARAADARPRTGPGRRMSGYGQS